MCHPEEPVHSFLRSQTWAPHALDGLIVNYDPTANSGKFSHMQIILLITLLFEKHKLLIILLPEGDRYCLPHTCA